MPDLTLVANKTAAPAARDDSFDTPELWKHVQAAHQRKGRAALLAHLEALRAADKHALWCAEVNLDGAGEHIAELQQDVARARHQALEDAARAAEAHSLAEQLTRMMMANPLSHSLNLVGVVAKAIRALQEVVPAAPEPSAMPESHPPAALRARFEAHVRATFHCSPHSLARDDQGNYYGVVAEKGGRNGGAPVSMLWQTWQGAHGPVAGTAPAVADSQLVRDISADAVAFETALGRRPERIACTAYPWGWRYAEKAIQAQFRDWCQGEAGTGR